MWWDERSQRERRDQPGVKRERRTRRESKAFVGGLDQTVTDAALANKFSTYGVLRATVATRWASGRSRGFGFVTFPPPPLREWWKADIVKEVIHFHHALFSRGYIFLRTGS